MKIKILHQTQRAELLLMLGPCLFIGGTIGFLAGCLSQPQISAIAGLALIFAGVGSGKKELNKNQNEIKMKFRHHKK
jgi:hypothetical protein